jgi:hypothetical protein
VGDIKAMKYQSENEWKEGKERKEKKRWKIHIRSRYWYILEQISTKFTLNEWKSILLW